MISRTPTPDDVESVLAAVETIPPSLFDHYEGSRENEPVRGHDRLHAAQDGERKDERAVLIRLEHAPELIRDPPHEVREVLGRGHGGGAFRSTAVWQSASFCH